MARIMGWLACVSAVVLLVVAMATGTAPARAATGARVTGAWVRLAAVPGRPAAAYFTLTAGDAPIELVRVESPLARIELHSASMAGGIMRMNRLPSVRLAAGERTVFTSAGSHLMLFSLPATVLPGATVPLAFRFADGTTLRVEAVTQAAGADAPAAIGAPAAMAMAH